MEETIGYEALFSAEEWDAIVTGDLTALDEEVALEFGATSPDGTEERTHDVTVYGPPGQHAGNEDRFEIECESCGDIGAADTEQEAQAIARLHEVFVATLVESWSVDR